jgi:hypothetical protein
MRPIVSALLVDQQVDVIGHQAKCIEKERQPLFGSRQQREKFGVRKITWYKPHSISILGFRAIEGILTVNSDFAKNPRNYAGLPPIFGLLRRHFDIDL